MVHNFVEHATTISNLETRPTTCTVNCSETDVGYRIVIKQSVSVSLLYIKQSVCGH